MSRTGCAFAILAATVAASTVNAATFNVSAGQSIQAAINLAADDDLILVGPGTYVEHLELTGVNVIIQSTDGPQATIIDANHAASVVRCFALTSDTCRFEINGFTLTNGNGTNGQGGGLLLGNAAPIIRNCIITNNASGIGGGVFCNASNPLFFGCVFYQNSASSFGGDCYNIFSNPNFVNCTFNGSTATLGSGIHSNDTTSHPAFTNCIIWGYDDDVFSGLGVPIVGFTCIENGYPGLGNIDDNPLFVNLASGNLRVQNGSPCIDAGDSVVVAMELARDIDGNSRGVDVPTMIDTGIPIFGLVVDMGAYEIQNGTGGPSECSCTGDITPPGGNGFVNIDDLVTVLNAFGACP
ncbi:MAG: hypothetical protein KC983_06715 [Phycisphaerales bacterium]|nr:hypothetical protein [Phycisphaerales bacterium]